MFHKKTGLLWVIGMMIIIGLTSSTNKSPDIIYWNADQQLSWQDFKGHPQYQYRDISAITSSGIVHYKGCKDGQINYKVQAYFEKKESWVKAEALTRHHLEHEQIHFDITELYARKLRKALSQRDFYCGEEAAFETFVEAVLGNWQAEQQAYDMLTHHSLDKEQQKEWYHKIAMELSLLEDFKDLEN